MALRQIALAGSLLLALSAPATAETSLRIWSERGDLVGFGQSHYFTPADGHFSVERSAQGNIENFVFASFAGPEHRWDLFFVAPGDEPLSPGLYLNAVGYVPEDPDEPGIIVVADGDGCRTDIMGSFEVKQIEYGPGESIVSFWARFVQHCSGMIPLVTGEIRFNADVPFAMNAPPGRTVVRGETLTFPVFSTPAKKAPATLSVTGLPAGAAFIDNHNNTGTFTWTPTVAQIGTHVVTFEGESAQGRSDRSVTVIGVNGLTSLLLRSEPGDYVGQGRDLFFGTDDGYFTAEGTTDLQAAVVFTTWSSDRTWFLAFAAPSGVPFTAGSYFDAGPDFCCDRPGLLVVGEGRGCQNTSGQWDLTGSFEIKEIRYGRHDAVSSFWATFEQHCEGVEPALFGEIRFNANVIVELTAPLRHSVLARRHLLLPVEATDEAKGTVELTAEDLPQGATFLDNGDNTGTLSWTPTVDQIGTHSVKFLGRNEQGETGLATTWIEVQPCTAGVELTGRWSGLRYSCAPSAPRRQVSCSVRGSLRLTNESKVRALATETDVFLSDDTSLDPGDLFLNRTPTRPVSPQSFVDLRLGVQLETGVSALGKYLIALLDATDVEPECNEANTVVHGPISLSGVPRR